MINIFKFKIKTINASTYQRNEKVGKLIGITTSVGLAQQGKEKARETFIACPVLE